MMPSTHVFLLPDLGEGATEAEIVAWHVKPGEAVEEDQLIAEVMTDKATMELYAPVSGTLTAAHGAPGERRAVGSPLAEFALAAQAGRKAEEPTPTPPIPPQKDPPRTPPPGPDQEPLRLPDRPPPEMPPPGPDRPEIPEPGRPGPEIPHENPGFPGPGPEIPPPPPAAGHPRAAPAIRARAARLGLDLAAVAGSGAEGRVVHADLDSLLTARAPGQGSAAAPAGAATPLTGLRRVIAERMERTWRAVPHFTYVEEVDAGALERLRAALNERAAAGAPRLTPLPFFIRAVARALADFPDINATYDEETRTLTRHARLHAGIATATPAGLLVPVLRDAGAKDLPTLARDLARLAQAGREGRLARADLTGSTFTLSSLGKLGGLMATPILNAPEVGILAVNRIRENARLNLSASFDHRIIDGDVAARFVQAVKALIEEPALLFI